MANYNQKEVSGNAWTRAFQITVDNPYNGTPSILFSEENILDLGDRLINGRSGMLEQQLTMENAFTQFPLLDPATNNETGALANYAQLQQMLHSIYMYLAKERDILKTQPFPSWTWNAQSEVWEPPVPMPETGEWAWDEGTQSWIEQL